MLTMPCLDGEVILGVDTHKDIHVAVLLDRLGRYLAAASFGTSDAANRELVAWTRRYGQVTTAGVEGTGSYGYRLAQHLTAQGIITATPTASKNTAVSSTERGPSHRTARAGPLMPRPRATGAPDAPATAPTGARRPS